MRVNITEDLEMMTCVMKAGLHSEKIRQEQFLGYGWQETCFLCCDYLNIVKVGH